MGEREREATKRERENSNTSSKTLILKDRSAEGQGGEKEGGVTKRGRVDGEIGGETGGRGRGGSEK